MFAKINDEKQIREWNSVLYEILYFRENKENDTIKRVLLCPASLKLIKFTTYKGILVKKNTVWLVDVTPQTKNFNQIPLSSNLSKTSSLKKMKDPNHHLIYQYRKSVFPQMKHQDLFTLLHKYKNSNLKIMAFSWIMNWSIKKKLVSYFPKSDSSQFFTM